MYAHLFSVRFQQWRPGGHLFLTPMIRLLFCFVLAYISKIVQDSGLVTIIHKIHSDSRVFTKGRATSRVHPM